MTIRFSGRTQPLYPKYTILDALETIKRVGFDGVEICLEVDELVPAELTPARIEVIRARVASLGLAPHAVGYHRDYIYDDAMFEQTKIAIHLTPTFGTDILIFSGTRPRPGDDAAWARMLARTRELVALAEEAGVVLAQEFEPAFIVGSTADLLRLFEAIPSPNLAANLDLGHVFLCDPDPLAAIRQLGTKIVHGHVENMRVGVHDHLPPHEGDMDLGAYLRALDEVGFAGGLTLDLYKQDYEAIAPAALATLRGLME
ncbi:MAG: sugar phosphate isomerase/epimerase [Anaerolineae bacterium]|nr:sugar phosphate isomerase/epimerase [Anaerolineae bacterium]